MDKLSFKPILVGLNPLGDVVMHCEVCNDTFAKKVQTRTLEDLTHLALLHINDRHTFSGIVGGGA